MSRCVRTSTGTCGSTIVTNLVSNALKLHTRWRSQGSLSSEDNLAVLTVADTGIGNPV